MKQRIYLDTSVISLHDDPRSPDRRALTREFWRRISDFEVSISEVTTREIEETPDAARREQMLRLVTGLPVLQVTPEAKALARRYLTTAIFPPKVVDDALHVAIAILSRQNILVSWNFKHLVNQRRRAAIDALNIGSGLPTIAILSPPEL
ncbi:MAG: type II toxin-antitoxin system VapC family toxin [Phycisphaeraceae bacterium]|nr:type II toxin-antitoxin system VapC family toxin [Phycisphaeraceae bacterium]MBX3405647.1 type II toxin-antitoxin system VapC family toxin [Phycisphaeraceae bacterium]